MKKNNTKHLFRRFIDRIAFGDRERKFAAAGFYFYSSSFISFISHMLSVVVFLKYLGIHDYGLLALAMSTSGIIYGFIDMRAYEGIVRVSLKHLAENNRAKVAHIITVGHILNCAIAVLVYITTYFLAPSVSIHILHEPVAKAFIRMYGIVWAISSLSVTPYSIFLIFNEHATLNLLNGLHNILRFIFPLVLIKTGLRGIIAGTIIAYCLITILFLYSSGSLLMKHLGKQKVNIKEMQRALSDIFPFMWYSFLSETLKSFSSHSLILIVGYFRNPTEVTYFKVATAFAGITSYAATPVSPLVFSKLSQLWTEGKMKLFLQALTKGRIYLFLISLCMTTILASVSPLILPFLFGKTTKEMLTVTHLMLLMYFFICSYSWLRPYFLAINKPEFSTYLSTLYLVINFPVTILCTRYYGITGTAFGNFICAASVNLILTPLFLRQEKGV